MIQGSLTHLNSPQGVAVDNTNHEVVVSNDGRLSILVFDRLANGNVAPLREIIGPATGITTPEGIVVDPVHDEIILADEGDPEANPVVPPSLRIFRRTDSGNVTPFRVITGPSTGLIRPRQLQLDTERDELVLADRGLPQEFIYAPETQGYIGFWNRTDSGDQPPTRIIRVPRSQLSSPRAVYIDMENDEIGAGDTTSHSIIDRKSTRLNSSHRCNSYAVFCLKKKTLEIRSLMKLFYRPAVNGLDLTVRAGEFYSLLGPNGAGKTTTLRMVAGLLPPDAGSIHICGIDALRDPVGAKRIVAWVSDEPMIYDKLTPYEYLEFVAGLWTLDADIAETRARDLMDWLGLSPHAHERCEGFSKGMRQKVALAGALVHGPRV